MDKKETTSLIENRVINLRDKIVAYNQFITKFNNDPIHKILACETTVIQIGNNEYGGMLCGAGALFIINVESDIKQIYKEITQDVEKYTVDILKGKKIDYIDKVIFDEVGYYCDLTTRTIADLTKMLTQGVVMHHNESVPVGTVAMLLDNIANSVYEINIVSRQLYDALAEIKEMQQTKI